MGNLEFINHHRHPIQVKGKDGKSIRFVSGQRRVLPDYFRKYYPRYLSIVGISDINNVKKINPRRNIGKVKKKRPVNTRKIKRQVVKQPAPPKQSPDKKTPRRRLPRSGAVTKRRTVGGKIHRSPEATKYFKKVLELVRFPISDEVGVGILSFNRLKCVKRLITSMRAHTDLNKVTVFVSDESTDKSVKAWLFEQKDITVLDNKERIGIAGNTNRLMRCLQRFKYKVIFNDDVEILKSGWEAIYPSLMEKTGYHHFCMRQPGIQGANNVQGQIKTFNGDLGIQTVLEKPHGAVMAFDNVAFEAAGYFDENFGIYGMEHVDWSNRVGLSGVQPTGFHDVIGSSQFFKIHNATSSVASAERIKSFKEAKAKYEQVKKDKSRIHISPSEQSEVPEVSFIVPFRGADRRMALATVIANIKGQRFPHIEIIVVEQDHARRAKVDVFGPIKYMLVQGKKKTQPFTKSIAFNQGVLHASCEKVILHDADMLVNSEYARKVYGILNKYEACHIGETVIYLNNGSTDEVVRKKVLSNKLVAKTTVGYFEGGSLGCRRSKYFQIGGFYEEFIGYGCEDCEFFERLQHLTNFLNTRTEAFIHLEHGRAQKWEACHARNKIKHQALIDKGYNARLSTMLKSLRRNGYAGILRELDGKS